MRSTLTATDLFSTKGRVEVLRQLWGVSVPMVAADVARRAGLTHPTASGVLRDLEEYGVVSSAPAGRGNTYWLNRESAYTKAFVDPVFSAEIDIPERLLADISSLADTDTLSLVLFGSYARGDQTTQSDFDVIAVAQDAAAKDRVQRRLDDFGVQFRRKYGATLSAIVYSADEAAELPERAPALYSSLLDDGIRVTGLSVLEWSGRGTK